MISKLSVLLLAAVMVFGQSCNVYDVLVSGTKVEAAEKLWADVPAVENAEKIETELPPVARIALGVLLAQNVNYIAYTTDRTAKEVEGLYSEDRMRAAGWKRAQKCIGDTNKSKQEQGSVCVYVRTGAETQNGLAIFVAENSQEKETFIFYMRFDIVDEEAPTTKK